MNSTSIFEIMKAYHRRGGYNFLAVRWSDDNNGMYNIVRARMPKIGEIIGKRLYEMHTQKFINLTNWHLIGHSLGSHMIGYIGRSVYNASKQSFKFKLLTALDPGLFL